MVSVQNHENRPDNRQEDDREILPEDLLDTDPAIQMPDSSSDKLKILLRSINKKKESIDQIKKALQQYQEKRTKQEEADPRQQERNDSLETIEKQKIKLESITDKNEQKNQAEYIQWLIEAHERAYGTSQTGKDEEAKRRAEEADEFFANRLAQLLEKDQHELEELEKRYDDIEFEIDDTGANA
ncbi:MAG: hypothetical protein KBD73_02000 [Candidatus Magasanikbacteria bacterium]|nr:hypothetical protein [Candidatus Magasanikbacteria bacterium]